MPEDAPSDADQKANAPAGGADNRPNLSPSPTPAESIPDGSDRVSLLSTLSYGLSLPERTARSASAMVGGLVNETAARLIPAAFRSSRSYSVFVQQALDMMVHDVGGVANPHAEVTQEGMLARKAVGGLLDVAGAATLHLSPMTVLAVFNDLAYGSGVYLGKLSEELKREGIIDSESSIDHVADLIAALRDASAKAADTVDSPPISVEAFTDTVKELSNEIGKADPRKLLPQAEVQRMWGEMETAANDADVGLWDVSTTMTMFAMNRVSLTSRGALSTLSVAGSLFDQHIIRHYSEALDEISESGLYVTLAEVSAPYWDAVWENFDEGRETWTEDLLSGKLFDRAWTEVRGWWSADTGEASPIPNETAQTTSADEPDVNSPE